MREHAGASIAGFQAAVEEEIARRTGAAGNGPFEQHTGAHAASEESARLRAQTIRAEEAYKSGFYAGARYVDPQQQPNVLYMPTETCFDAWIATRAGQEGAKEESDE